MSVSRWLTQLLCWCQGTLQRSSACTAAPATASVVSSRKDQRQHACRGSVRPRLERDLIAFYATATTPKEAVSALAAAVEAPARRPLRFQNSLHSSEPGGSVGGCYHAPLRGPVRIRAAEAARRLAEAKPEDARLDASSGFHSRNTSSPTSTSIAARCCCSRERRPTSRAGNESRCRSFRPAPGSTTPLQQSGPSHQRH